MSDLPNSFDGGNTMFCSATEGQYVIFFRCNDGGRSMARATSKDFMTWTKPVPMTYGDSPREQFYVNNTQPYVRSSHLYVALAARFMEGRRAITAERGEAADLRPAVGKRSSGRLSGSRPRGSRRPISSHSRASPCG